MNQSKPGGESYYARHYSADDLQRLAQINHQQAMMNDSLVHNLMANSGMDSNGMIGGRTLDELVNQNNNEQSRRSYHQQLGGMDFAPDVDAPRSSMMEFGAHRDNGLGNYQFEPSPIVASPISVPDGGGMAKRRMDNHMANRRRDSRGALGLDTQFNDMNPSFNAMVQSPAFQQPLSSDQIDLDSPANYIPNMSMALDYSNMSQDMSAIDMYAQPGFQVPLSTQLQQQSVRPMIDSSQQHGGDGNNGSEQALMEKMPQMNVSDAMMDNNFIPPMENPTTTGSDSMSSVMAQGQPTQSLENSGPLSQEASQPTVQSEPQQADQPTNGTCTMRTFTTSGEKADTKRKGVPQYPNAYSQTGFDMLGVLMRIATRPKPQINIGAVDMSCAFVVCDALHHDVPIVYCSEVFERLTGYTRHEILGRNCRFLQAPDGKVQAGVKRKYVDDQAVFHLKHAIAKHQEAQISIINYRKGGQPFMNLLTMIPIAWDTETLRYYVGFQVDLVEQPTSITNKNPDGSYSINYQQGLLPRYVLNNTPESNRGKELEIGQPMERDDVSMVLGTLGTGESELSKRVWDKVLLENSDDVLHVLSLKGLFLYLSQASRKILEYEPHELVGAALSSVCHPSDIVPVTRELKDTTPGATVNVVYRIRRKHSGYTWFESHGALHTEQGKGKKCIILVGRERPVYALQRSELVNVKEIGENELWTKMSTSGMFLFVSTNARSLLDRQPDELRGTSAQALMRSESKAEFNRVLDIARAGIKTTLKHDIQNKRGQTLHAQTTLYPGDACEGQKPTFLVAQTKLLKMSRSTPALNKQNSTHSDKSNPASGGSTIVSPGFAASQGAGQLGLPQPGNNAVTDTLVTSAGGCALAIGSQHQALASEDNVFDELKTTRSTSWQFELRQMEKRNRVLAEEMQSLNSSKKKRKRRIGLGQLQKDCANCHTRSTPEWRRGPSGQRDLCNSCGLRWAKQNGRVSPRTSSQHSDKNSDSPASSSPANPTDKAATIVSPKETKALQQQEGDPYNAPQTRTEQPGVPGYGGGFPAKIEEVAEPMED